MSGVFTKQENEIRLLKKAAHYSAGMVYEQPEVQGLTVGDSPEFADVAITSLAAVPALGNSAKSVKSYLTQLWSKISALSGSALVYIDEDTGTKYQIIIKSGEIMKRELAP